MAEALYGLIVTSDCHKCANNTRVEDPYADTDNRAGAVQWFY